MDIWSESINTGVGFYARKCKGKFNVDIATPHGGCDETDEEILIGEYCQPVSPE